MLRLRARLGLRLARTAHALHVSEAAQRLGARGLGRQALGEQLLGAQLQVVAQLLVHVRAHVLAPEAQVAPPPRLRPPAHAASGTKVSTWVTAWAKRSQLTVWSLNCCRPAGVRE